MRTKGESSVKSNTEELGGGFECKSYKSFKLQKSIKNIKE